MLDAHSSVSAPHPPHLLRTFYPLLQHYGDLSELENRRALVDDMCDWVKANPVPWDGVSLNQEMILNNAKSIIDVFSLIYQARMDLDQANIWCCKSTFNVNYVEDLEANIRPFYIYLYRDGRDVASSFKKAIVGPKHTYHLARKWSEEQQSARAFIKTLPVERYIAMAYEEVITKPELCLRTLCEKLEIPFEPGMLEFYSSEESHRTADSGELWRNVLKPVIKDNLGKYQQELSQDDIALFESVAGIELDTLGYERVSNENKDFDLDIPIFEEENLALQAKYQKSASKQDIEKRQAQKDLLQAIHTRLGLIKSGPVTNP